MKLSHLIYSFPVGFALLIPSLVAEQLSNDPQSYFGGTNHQAYLDWVNNGVDAKYDQSVFIPSRDHSSGAAIHWTADDQYIHIAVAARCSGWIGFGISEAGGMLGSDMALFSSSRPNEIVDAHVVEVAYPKKDDCQQDWELVNSSTPSATTLSSRASASGGEEVFLMFEARRKLDTGDPQDKKIINDADPEIPAHRVIAAWGDDPEVTYHGPNVARGSIRFYGTEEVERAFNDAMAVNAEGSFVVGASNYTIPANETMYKEICFSRADLIAQGVPNTTAMLNMIGFRPVVPEGPSAPFVHHFVVTGGFNTSDMACENLKFNFNMVYVWAPGDGPFALPDFLGSRLFGPGGFQSFNIEIHYNNPRLTSDIVDSSGVEIFYTSQPRQMEMGIAIIGDPQVSLFGEPVGSGLSSHSFACPSACSEVFLAEPVTVVREYLHMHATGSRMINEQINSGGDTVRVSAVEVWDFNQNGNVPPIQEPFVVEPGDRFQTTCFYRGDNDTVFGLGSQDEMCMTFLYYYPKQTLSFGEDSASMTIPWMCGHNVEGFDNACNATYDKILLESDQDMHRAFGALNQTQCALKDSQQNPSNIASFSVDTSNGQSGGGSTWDLESGSTMSTSSARPVVISATWAIVVASLLSLLV